MTSYDLGLIAHDAKKEEMAAWVGVQHDLLLGRQLVATASTGALLKELGGDQEIGALIARQKLAGLIFLIDPLSPLPHDVDVKALTRLAVLYDIPFASNRSTADRVMRSGWPTSEKDRP